MNRIKIIKLTMIALSDSLLVSCGKNREDIATIITEELGSRYGETFIVDSMGGRNFEDKTLKAWVYPEGKKEDIFKIELSGDYKEIKDEYKVILVSNEISSIIESLAEPIFGDVFIDSPVWGEEANQNKQYTNLYDFFTDTNYSGIGVNVYINTYGEINKEEESAKIIEFLVR